MYSIYVNEFFMKFQRRAEIYLICQYVSHIHEFIFYDWDILTNIMENGCIIITFRKPWYMVFTLSKNENISEIDIPYMVYAT